jgi:pyruvate dehydrogenase (quinone)
MKSPRRTTHRTDFLFRGREKEFIEYDNPYDVGMTGLLGFASGYQAMVNCEALLVLGSDFPYQQFYPKDAKIIQVDLRGEQIGRRTRVDVGIVGTMKETLQVLPPLLESDRKWEDLRISTDYRPAVVPAGDDPEGSYCTG